MHLHVGHLNTSSIVDYTTPTCSLFDCAGPDNRVRWTLTGEEQLLKSKQKIASGGMLATLGGVGIVLSTVATSSGTSNPTIIALLFAAGVIAGLGVTLAVVGLFERRRLTQGR